MSRPSWRATRHLLLGPQNEQVPRVPAKQRMECEQHSPPPRAVKPKIFQHENCSDPTNPRRGQEGQN